MEALSNSRLRAGSAALCRGSGSARYRLRVPVTVHKDDFHGRCLGVLDSFKSAGNR